MPLFDPNRITHKKIVDAAQPELMQKKRKKEENKPAAKFCGTRLCVVFGAPAM
jgi:hypothetical protein